MLKKYIVLLFFSLSGICFGDNKDMKQQGRVLYYKKNVLTEEIIESGQTLAFLYNNSIGKALRFLLKRKFVADLYALYKHSSWSVREIKPFIKKHSIVMDDFVVPEGGFASFNHFFIRALKPGARLIDQRATMIPSPADGKAFVISNISEEAAFFVKNEKFDLRSFLRSDELYEKFKGGTLVIVRLAPPDYHRLHIPLDGVLSKPTIISGIYESVNPIAYAAGVQPLLSNERHLVLLQTQAAGLVAMVPVGATFVGRIKYLFDFKAAENSAKRGEELGYFEFGGSTVVLLFEPGKVVVRDDIVQHSAEGYETAVVTGEAFATILSEQGEANENISLTHFC